MRGEVVSRRIVKPENCVLAFGIPTSKEEFTESRKRGNRRFASLFDRRFGAEALKEYRIQFLNDLERLEPVLKDLGLHMEHGITLRDLRTQFHGNKYDVVVVFTHSEGEALELTDGFADASAILHQVPQSFSGIIDLCVCNPVAIALELRCNRPNLLIRYSKTELEPYFWLYFYRVLFQYLKEQDITYLKAVEDVTFGFLKIAKGRPFYEKVADQFRSVFKKAREDRRDPFGKRRAD